MILLTGASGQLGHAIRSRLAARGDSFKALQRPAFDFCEPAKVAAGFAAAKPELVINAAAYTAVDKAETDQAAAYAANHAGPRQLAELCENSNIPFIHVSTDYVFDGNKGSPYLETDPTSPSSVYGASKRDGEQAILATNARAIILRAAWVYSAQGRNFARTMIEAGRKMPVLRVVSDQRGTPTAADDLAAGILNIVDRIRQIGWCGEFRGIFHATSAGETTWYGFAEAIFQEAEKLGYPAPELQPIATLDWPTPARRPPDSRLDCNKLQQIFDIGLPHWRATLPDVVRDLVSQSSQG